ncbi:MAG TPA: hypothetical protein VH143_15735 [Kofleriaceae bacterium]|nr:hypothetical protein [Kofleriaceae bacterium]
MKVILAHSDASTRRRFAQWLTSANHVVHEAGNVAAACSLVSQGADVVIADWHLAGGGASFVKYVRSLDAQHRHYLVVTCGRALNHDITAVVAAGADDFAITSSVTQAEMLARVDGLKRARASAAIVGGSNKSVEFGPLFDLDKVRAWRDVDAIIASELGEQLGAPLQAVVGPSSPVAYSGAISLSLANEKIELQLGIGIERDMVAPFGAALLDGDTSEATLADALRELANVAGGAVKRGAVNDGVSFTIGLPSNAMVCDLPDTRSWYATTSSGLRLRITAIAWASVPRSVRRADLREGMVLASDVRNAAGMLLVTAGTYLTSTTVNGLDRTLDANTPVEVMVPMSGGTS